MTHDEMIEVIAAHRDGKRIQFKKLQNKIWTEIEAPVWNFCDYKYRVKPEPIEAWAVVDNNNKTYALFSTEEYAKEALEEYENFRIVHLVEKSKK